MLQIIVAYDSATNLITLTSSSSVAGTVADIGNVQIQVTGLPAGYTAQIDYGVKLYNNAGIPINPSDVLIITDTTGIAMISDGVLDATYENGKLPIQLVLTDTTNTISLASYNQIVLDVRKAINSTGKILKAYTPAVLGAYVSSEIDGTKISFGTLSGSTEDLELGNDLEFSANKITAWPATPDDIQYPSAKLTKDTLDTKAEADEAITSIKKNGVALAVVENTVDIPIPVALSELAEDTTHRVATDDEKALWNTVSDKVDKIAGKGLSTNDYTDEAESAVNALGTASTKNTGTASGNVPILGTNGKLADSTLPALAISEYVGAVTLKTDLTTITTADKGDWAVVNGESGESVGLNGSYICNGDPTILANWIQMMATGGTEGIVYSVNGRVGIVVLTSSDVGLGDTVNGAQINVIETVKVNGTALIPIAKAVDVTVPTALSELAEDTTHRLVTDTEKEYWNNKEDSVVGKGLSTNDYDDAAKAIVDGTPDALAGKQKIQTEGANIIFTDIGDSVQVSAQLGELPVGVIQHFYMDSSNSFGATKPITDVSAEISLVGTTAIEVPNYYTAPLASSFDTQTVMKYHVRITGLTIGTTYTWRPVLRAVYDSVSTIVAEIPSTSSISFTATDTVYIATVSVPYALYVEYNAPAGTVFNFALRMVKTGTDTQTPYIATDIATEEYIYFSRSGGFISTDQVYEVVDSVVKSQHTINSEFKADLDTIDSGAQLNALSSLPTASATYLGKVYQYIGSTGTYVQNSFYKCILTETVYSWEVCDPVKLSLSDANPVVNGTASPGTSASASRSDHVHPLANVSASNITVSTWVANTDNTTDYDKGFIYMADVAVTGMLATMYPKVEVDDATYITGNVWNRYESFNGFIRIYSKTNTTITVLTAIGEVIA